MKPTFVLDNYTQINFIKTGRPCCNASFFKYNNELYILGRETNYTFYNNVFAYGITSGNVYSDEIIYKFDEKTSTATYIKHLLKTTNEDKEFHYSGYEDGRIVNWNGDFYLTFTCPDPKHRFKIHYLKMNKSFEIEFDKSIDTGVWCEKNWQPIETMPGYYVYSYKPFKLIQLDKLKYMNLQNKCDSYSGSSPIIKYGKYNVGLIHKRFRTSTSLDYYTYFVFYDDKMNLLKISKPFMFLGAHIEFNTSIIEYNGNLRIIFAVYDNLIYYCDISKELLEDIKNDKLKNNKIDFERIHKMFYYDSLTNKNLRNAIGMATFVKDKEIISEAVTINYNYDFGNKENKMKLQKKLIELYNKK